MEQGESLPCLPRPTHPDSFLTAQVFDLAGYAVTAPAVFQTLPSLGEPDDEVIDLFSQDVRDLFVDGLPETVDEAVLQLEDAGLFGEVIAVLDENDLAGDALLRGSGASPGPAEVSVDVSQGFRGDTWCSSRRSTVSVRSVCASTQPDPRSGDGPGNGFGGWGRCSTSARSTGWSRRIES